jgi:COP9 signalosome complex subunit 5
VAVNGGLLRVHRPTNMASSSDTALKTFSLTNEIREISPQDEIYKYDADANKRLIREQPWTSE